MFAIESSLFIVCAACIFWGQVGLNFLDIERPASKHAPNHLRTRVYCTLPDTCAEFGHSLALCNIEGNLLDELMHFLPVFSHFDSVGERSRCIFRDFGRFIVCITAMCQWPHHRASFCTFSALSITYTTMCARSVPLRCSLSHIVVQKRLHF